jgi:hypothetical protein
MAIQMKIKVVKTNKHTVNFSMFIVLLFRNKRVLSIDEENICYLRVINTGSLEAYSIPLKALWNITKTEQHPEFYCYNLTLVRYLLAPPTYMTLSFEQRRRFL